MKKAYQIDERRAIEKFRSHLLNDRGTIQMILPLAEIAQGLRGGVAPFLLQAQRQLLLLIMEDDVNSITGPRYQRAGPRELWRGGHEDGSVVINGQKVPVQRPRVRSDAGEVKIGSYELFRREEDQQRRIWDAITRGLTMRGYGPTVRECEEAFAIEKSAVSEKFVTMSAKKVDELLKRDLGKMRLCALLLDGVEVKQQHLVTALGIDHSGRKTILGFHQGASENQAACDSLFSDLANRGLDFRQPHLNLIDGSKALRAVVRKYCGDASPILRCQLHKRRNIVGYFAEQPVWDRKLANAYDLRSRREAKTALLRIQDELNHVNPSAARSLEEGLEETLTCTGSRFSGTLEDATQHQLYRVGLLDRPGGLPQREAVAARRSNRALGWIRAIGGREAVSAHCWISCVARFRRPAGSRRGHIESGRSDRLRVHNGPESRRES